MNVFIPLLFDGYNYSSHTISELSAIGAPTRRIWVALALGYVALLGLFGVGVWRAANGNRRLGTMAVLILIYCAWNVYWPPMHARGMEPTFTDTLHIVWAAATVLLMFLMMGFGAAALDRGFRLYTVVTVTLMTGFGTLTGMDGPKIHQNVPTPLLGIWERILIALFMFWLIVLSIRLRRAQTAVV